jgi:hypothetical protein
VHRVFQKLNIMLKILNHTILILALTCPIIASSAQVSSLNIPKKFYSDEFGQCKINRRNGNIINAQADGWQIKPIIGFDWQKHHNEKSTSLRVAHEPLSKPMAFLSASAHNAGAEQDLASIKITTDFIYQIALNNSFLNTIEREESLKTRCYAAGDTSAPCPSHAPQHLAINLTTYLITAIWMKEYFNQEQLAIIDNYIHRVYKKYILPYALLDNQRDGYMTEMANMGIGRLAYANWNNDPTIAETEFEFRMKQIDQAVEDSGYIRGNSYRGVRGIFYHSMGVDIMLVYIQLAKAWNYPVSSRLLEKIKKSAELINVYSRNSTDYYNYPDSKIPYNSSRDPKDTAGIHQQAIALGLLMKNVVNLNFLSEERYERLRRQNFIDVMVGFDPSCMFSAQK